MLAAAALLSWRRHMHGAQRQVGLCVMRSVCHSFTDAWRCASEHHDLNAACRLSRGKEVAVLVVDGTKLVQEAQNRHQLAPTATAALGRALLGSVLMSIFRKDGETLQVTFAADGPLRVRPCTLLLLRCTLMRLR